MGSESLHYTCFLPAWFFHVWKHCLEKAGLLILFFLVATFSSRVIERTHVLVLFCGDLCLQRLVFFCGDLCACFSKIQNKNNKTNFRPNICILALVYGNLTASRFFGKSPGLIWSASLFLRGKIKICFTSYIRGRGKTLWRTARYMYWFKNDK